VEVAKRIYIPVLRCSTSAPSMAPSRSLSRSWCGPLSADSWCSAAFI